MHFSFSSISGQSAQHPGQSPEATPLRNCVPAAILGLSSRPANGTPAPNRGRIWRFPLLRKNFRESRWLLLGCTLTTYCFCWLRVWMVSRLSTDRFRAILEMLPGDWKRFLTVDLDWLVTYPGRISLAYQELLVILAMGIWCVARGSDAVSGELHRGTLEMLLAQPVSRWRLYLAQCAMTAAGVAVIAGAAWAGTWTGISCTRIREEVPRQIALPFYVPGWGDQVPLPFGRTTTRYVPMSDKVSASLFLPATFNLGALGIMMAGSTLLVSAYDRFRWRTIGIVSGFLIIQLMLKIASLAADSTAALGYLTVLSAYEPELLVRMVDQDPSAAWSWMVSAKDGAGHEAGPLANYAFLCLLGIASAAWGGFVFRSRDLPAPL